MAINNIFNTMLSMGVLFRKKTFIGHFNLFIIQQRHVGSEITRCNKIDEPLDRFLANIMRSIGTYVHNDKIITFLQQK